jgi:adenosylhomocysteine nucleosidase
MSAVSQGDSRTVRRTAAPIAVVTALKEEFEAVLSRAREARFRGTFVEARIGTSDVALCLTGDGAGQAGRAADLLCETVRPTALLGAGIAGALSTGLEIGDVLVSRRIRDSQGDVPAPDARLLAQALENTGQPALYGRQTRRPGVKKALAQFWMTAALPLPTWSRPLSAAASRGIPYLIARAISDRADEDLPEYLGRCVGSEAPFEDPPLSCGVARPATIPALCGCAAGSPRAQRVSGFLEEFPSGRAVMTRPEELPEKTSHLRARSLCFLSRPAGR